MLTWLARKIIYSGKFDSMVCTRYMQLQKEYFKQAAFSNFGIIPVFKGTFYK